MLTTRSGRQKQEHIYEPALDAVAAAQLDRAAHPPLRRPAGDAFPGLAASVGGVPPGGRRALALGAHRDLAAPRRRVGLAIENARLYRDERAAHLGAEQAKRARDNILAIVSHDLRNPLTAIVMRSSRLVTIGGSDAQSVLVRKSAETIQRAGQQMARMIQDLVDLSGLQSGQVSLDRRPHAVAEIAAAAVDMFAEAAQERELVLESSIEPGLPSVECDFDRALQAVSNVVANAIKVTAAGGRVSVSARAMGPEVVVLVRDTGPGISPDELPHLFERYWRGSTASYKGTGLGLAITRGIMDAHGGRIWADSDPGRGSTFNLAFRREHDATEGRGSARD